MTCAEILLEGLEPKHVIADKGYDSDPLRRKIRSAGAKPVIPLRRNCRKRRHDRQRYKLRNVVERFINRLKHCRRVATGYDKLAATFLGFVQFASTISLTLNVHTTLVQVSHILAPFRERDGRSFLTGRLLVA